jgi:hypothetical protein
MQRLGSTKSAVAETSCVPAPFACGGGVRTGVCSHGQGRRQGRRMRSEPACGRAGPRAGCGGTGADAAAADDAAADDAAAADGAAATTDAGGGGPGDAGDGPGATAPSSRGQHHAGHVSAGWLSRQTDAGDGERAADDCRHPSGRAAKSTFHDSGPSGASSLLPSRTLSQNT